MAPPRAIRCRVSRPPRPAPHRAVHRRVSLKILTRKKFSGSMPFRIAMLALALAAAGAASAQTGAGDARSADADLDRTVVEADVIEGVSDLEVTARGNAEINRDDLSIFGDLLRYNRELGRAEGDGGVRLRRGSDRFFGPR